MSVWCLGSIAQVTESDRPLPVTYCRWLSRGKDLCSVSFYLFGASHYSTVRTWVCLKRKDVNVRQGLSRCLWISPFRQRILSFFAYTAERITMETLSMAKISICTIHLLRTTAPSLKFLARGEAKVGLWSYFSMDPVNADSGGGSHVHARKQWERLLDSKKSPFVCCTWVKKRKYWVWAFNKAEDSNKHPLCIICALLVCRAHSQILARVWTSKHRSAWTFYIDITLTHTHTAVLESGLFD